MRLGCEIHDGVDVMLLEQTGHERFIADIAFLKNIARVGGEVGEIGRVARVSEEVEIDELAERRGAFSQTLADEVAADESAAPGDKDIHE